MRSDFWPNDLMEWSLVVFMTAATLGFLIAAGVILSGALDVESHIETFDQPCEEEGHLHGDQR